MQAVGYSEDLYDLAQRVISGLNEQFATSASSIWLYAPPAHTCLRPHNLDAIAIGDRLEHVLTTGNPLFAEVEWPTIQSPAAQMLSIFPLTVEQATGGALAVVTAVPLASTA